MAGAGKIPISPEFLESFKNGQNEDNTEGPEDGGAAALEELNEAVGWILNTINNTAKNIDERYAKDPEFIDMYSELSVICAKRNVSSDLLKKSPELLLGTVTAGVVIETVITHRQIQAEKLQQQANTKQEGPEDE